MAQSWPLVFAFDIHRFQQQLWRNIFCLYFVPLHQLARNPAGTNFPLFQTAQHPLVRTYSNYPKYQM